jgi:hypothetical protein
LSTSEDNWTDRHRWAKSKGCCLELGTGIATISLSLTYSIVSQWDGCSYLTFLARMPFPAGPNRNIYFDVKAALI